MSRMPTQRLPCGHFVQHEEAQGCRLCREVPVVAVAGTYMDRSLADFARACEVYIKEEQRKLAPDNTLIRLLEDSTRLTLELTALAHRHSARTC